ncbi:MAG: S24 family peptidase [Candidatus Cloacimonetes bacterium]|jgi:SOS-response transcriptional repressor LexA|nr:S24 family peptidase [Candidatus Cloacimonadota bacterium]
MKGPQVVNMVNATVIDRRKMPFITLNLKHGEYPQIYLKNKLDNHIVFRVNGQNMEPLIMNNHIVVIQKKEDWSNADGAVCTVRVNDGIILKRVQFDHHRQQVLLHPFNAEYRVQVIDSLQGDDLSLIGTMVLQFRIN